MEAYDLVWGSLRGAAEGKRQGKSIVHAFVFCAYSGFCFLNKNVNISTNEE